MIKQLIRKYSHVNWALADQAMVSGVNFLTGILFARFLGIEEFGRFTLVWMAVLFVNSIQMAMISAPMMSIGPKQTEEEMPGYYGAVAIQQVCFACLSFALLFAGVKLSGLFYPEWNVNHLALPLACVAFFFQMQDFLRRFFFTRGQHPIAFANDAISYLGQIGLLVCLFLSTRLDTAAVLWVIAGTSAIAVIAGSFFLRQLNWPHGQVVKISLRHWRFSKWLTASALLQWTSGNLFIVAAGGILGATAVGALKAAQNIMGVSHILFQGLGNIVPVRAGFHYSKSGNAGLLDYLKKVTCWGGLVTAAIALLAACFPGFWLSLFYGTEYNNYGFVLQWYAGIYLLIFLGLPLGAGLRAMEYSKPIFISYAFMTLFSGVMAVPLIQQFKLQGVMVGILIVNIIMVTILYMFMRRRGEAHGGWR